MIEKSSSNENSISYAFDKYRLYDICGYYCMINHDELFHKNNLCSKR